MSGQSSVSHGSHTARGIVCALVGAVCWGFSGTCGQLLMNSYGAPAEWITCTRMLVSAVFFLGVSLVLNWHSLLALLRDVRSLASIVTFSIFGVALCQMAYMNVIHYTSAGVGTTLEQFGLVFIMLWTCFRHRRLPKMREVTGLVLAFAGLVLIATQGDPTRLAVSPAGLAWGLAAAFALALYTLMPVKVVAKWGALLVTGMAMLIGGLFMTPAVQPWRISFDMSLPALGAFAAIVFAGTCAAYLLYLQGVTDAGPVRAGLLCAVEPVSAMLLAVYWLQTPVSGWDAAGCACILCMIVAVSDFKVNFKRGRAKTVSFNAQRGLEAPALPADPPVFAGRATQLGLYRSRLATMEDFDRIKALLGQAHEAYAKLGIDEGKFKRYPSARRLAHSIKNGTTHVVENMDSQLIAVFAVSFSPDKNYSAPISGSWLTPTDSDTQAYAELHWATVDEPFRRRGVGSFMVDRACRIARAGGRASLRADIYPENEPMRWLLEKHRFAFCGTFSVKDTFGREKPRSAYEIMVRP